MCNKNSYPTREAALQDAELSRANMRWKSKNMKGGRLRVYRCVYCGQFHLTSRSKSMDKKIQQAKRNRNR